ncbi:hypothetical protein GCM10008955_40740 [Deinococcus malanensis]|uniref:Uncharacterized protein n=1 Tax=Deinococcus malanensis TaxID=1706855 RepID=A0ABQ2F547_9DEIO|nr:hypothetical protein GCM10008955_40740 [Deinococcus malanensis]
MRLRPGEAVNDTPGPVATRRASGFETGGQVTQGGGEARAGWGPAEGTPDFRIVELAGQVSFIRVVVDITAEVGIHGVSFGVTWHSTAGLRI